MRAASARCPASAENTQKVPQNKGNTFCSRMLSERFLPSQKVSGPDVQIPPEDLYK